jgi:DNA repair protein RadC
VYSGIIRPRAHAPLPLSLREARSRYGKHVSPMAGGLAGQDLSTLWDADEFARRDGYCREFMQRMHHPFHEVLACLYLGTVHQAIAYNRYFRGEADSALDHLPTVVQTAKQLAASRLILAYNTRPRADVMRVTMHEFHGKLAEHGIQVHDFLLLVPG